MANSFGDHRWWFCRRRAHGQRAWFPTLGFGARALRGVFAKPSAWRVLDSGIAVVMGALGIGLLVH